MTSWIDQPLVIGGGPAGSAAAIHLARAGAPPLLIERTRETGDAICGGFLSWQTLATLDRMGLDSDALGGQRVTRVRLFAGGRSIETDLPHAGMGLSRRRLDSLLLDAAIAAGTGVERGITIRSIDAGQAVTDDAAILASPTLLLASGKHNVAGHRRTPSAHGAADPVIGLRQRIAASKAGERLVGDAVELFLFDRGYVGLVRQEDGSLNLCLAVHKSRLAEAESRPETLLQQWGDACPPLGDRLASADAIGRINAIAAVPYGWRARTGVAGVWLLGDQAGCIPSLAGEGMGIALASAESAVAAWRQGEAALSWQQRFADRLLLPMGVAGAAWRACENPWMAPLLLRFLRHSPGSVRAIARLTRISA